MLPPDLPNAAPDVTACSPETGPPTSQSTWTSAALNAAATEPEEGHLVPLELEAYKAATNLWAEPRYGTQTATTKDDVETKLKSPSARAPSSWLLHAAPSPATGPRPWPSPASAGDHARSNAALDEAVPRGESSRGTHGLRRDHPGVPLRGDPVICGSALSARSRAAVPCTPIPQRRTPPSCGGGVGR